MPRTYLKTTHRCPSSCHTWVPARMLRDQLGFSVRTPAWQHVLFTPTYLYRSQVDNRKLYFGLGLASTIAGVFFLVVDPSVKKHPVWLNILKTMTMTGDKEWPVISSGDQLYFLEQVDSFQFIPPFLQSHSFKFLKWTLASRGVFFW